MLNLYTPNMQRNASLACHMLTTRPHVRTFLKSLTAPRTTVRSIADSALESTPDHDIPPPTAPRKLPKPRPLPTTPPLEALLRSMSSDSTLAALAPQCTALAVDPDTSGAIALVHLQQANGAQWTVHTTLHDMPIIEVLIGQRVRRLPSATDALSMLAPLLVASPPPDDPVHRHMHQVGMHHAITTALPVGHAERPKHSWRLAVDHADGGAPMGSLFAVVEMPTPGPLTGKFAWYQGGYALATWHAVLGASGVPMMAVRPSVWKRALGLQGQGKDGSRMLAMQLFPEATPLLRRKKDHGRAEALLLAAWLLGVRYDAKLGMHILGSSSSSMEEGSESEAQDVGG